MKRSAILLLIPLFTYLIGIEGVPVVEKIVGGELATEGEFPWQVSLRLSGRHRCGGTLVSLQHVLTAGHCVFDVDVSRVTVVSGSKSLAQGGNTSLIRSVFIHPNYASVATSYHIHDVAVLILQTPLVETQFQRSIALAIEDPSEGSQAVVSGWGRLNADDEMIPTELQKLNVTIINATDCRGLWGPNIAIISGHLCGLQQVNNTGVCNGDSGSGLIWENQVVGIVSWANPCGLNYPDVYVRVYWYLSWIGSIVYNEEIETTLPPSTGGHVAMSHGNFVLLILYLCALRTIIIL